MDKTSDKHLTAFCQKLIQIPSYSGKEEAVARLLIEMALSLGYDDAFIDDYGNAICVFKGAKPGKKILFDGHMDTVPADPAKWTRDPFGAEIEDGKLYGRGASDMKCSLASMLFAAARLVPEKDRLAGEIYISGTVNEEQFEGIAFGAVLEAVKPDFVVIGEASEMKVKVGQRGRAEILLEAFGKGAHSSTPDMGKNAVYTLMDYMILLRDTPDPEDEHLGRGISVLTDIVSKPYPGASVVPYYAVATLDRRLLSGEDKESVLKDYEAVLAQLHLIDPDADMTISFARGKEKTYTGQTIEGVRFFPAWKFEPDSEFAALALKALENVGLPPTLETYAFCTNGSKSAGELGIPTIGFGPGEERLAHIDDEYILLAEVLQACKVYSEIMRLSLVG